MSININNLSLPFLIKTVFSTESDYHFDSITINGVESTFDLFRFLVDVYNYGLHELFHFGFNPLDVDQISGEFFDIANDCMKRIGFAVEVVHSPIDRVSYSTPNDVFIDSDDPDYIVGKSYMFLSGSDPAQLHNYALILYTRSKNLKIRFFSIFDDES